MHHSSSHHNSIYSILVSLSLCITLLHTITQYILYWYLYHCASLFFTPQLNIFYTGIFIIVHHSSSHHNSKYFILVSLSLCITLLHTTTQYILYWYLYQCASLFFTPQLNIFYTGIFIIVHHSSSHHNSIYSILVSISLCITLLHTTTQYILYWYLYHCASLFFTPQLNIFYTGIFIIVHHSSSHHNSIYSILVSLSVCTTHLHNTTQYILYWYLYHCASLFFTPQLNIFYTGIYIIVHHSSSHHNSIYSILVSLSLCITLLHTITQNILYWYLYHCASLFFTPQLNIFYTGIFIIVHHSSSHHNSKYFILTFLSLCITLLHTA